MYKQMKIVILSLITMFIFTACSSTTQEVESEDFLIRVAVSTILPTVKIISTGPTEQVEVKMFSDEEVKAITRTLAGECYDDKIEDKRKVTEVILNRVSNENFGDAVIDVVSAKGQFCGYWKQSRPISESDIQIAEEALEKWYANDCEALSDYLFFCAGPNRENIFRLT